MVCLAQVHCASRACRHTVTGIGLFRIVARLVVSARLSAWSLTHGGGETLGDAGSVRGNGRARGTESSRARIWEGFSLRAGVRKGRGENARESGEWTRTRARGNVARESERVRVRVRVRIARENGERIARGRRRSGRESRENGKL